MNKGRKIVFSIQVVILPVVAYLALTRTGVKLGTAAGISTAIFVALIALVTLITPILKRSDDEELRKQAVRKELEEKP